MIEFFTMREILSLYFSEVNIKTRDLTEISRGKGGASPRGGSKNFIPIAKESQIIFSA